MMLFFVSQFGDGIHEIDCVGEIIELKSSLDVLLLELAFRDLFHAVLQFGRLHQISHNAGTSNTRNLFCNAEIAQVLLAALPVGSGGLAACVPSPRATA